MDKNCALDTEEQMKMAPEKWHKVLANIPKVLGSIPQYLPSIHPKVVYLVQANYSLHWKKNDKMDIIEPIV